MKMEIEAQHILDTIEAVDSTNRVEAVFRFKEDRWLVKAMGAADVVMCGVLCPESCMESYSIEHQTDIGVRMDKLESFVVDGSDILSIELDGRTLKIEDDAGAYAELATLDPDSVQGADVNVPDINHEVTIYDDMSFIVDFINRAKEVTGISGYLIGAREDGVYIYCDGDDGRMDLHKEWDEFSDYDIDWSINNTQDGVDSHIPKDDNAIDALFSMEYTKSVSSIDGEPTLELMNQGPMRVVYDKESDNGEGMKVSYFVAPRHDKDERNVIPDRVTNGP